MIESFFQLPWLFFITVGWAIVILGTIEGEGKTFIGWPTSITLVLIGIISIFFRDQFRIFVPEYTSKQWFIIALSYLFLGLIWSLVKWFLYLLNEKKLNRRRPQADNNIDQISAWIIFWPFSLIRYLVGDFMFNIGHFIARMCGKLYDTIGKRVFGEEKE